MSKFFDEYSKDSQFGYHFTNIPTGAYGQFSKIREEFLEVEDAMKQDNPIMALMELSDLLIVIDAFVNRYNMTIEDLITMGKATSRAYHRGEKDAEK